MSASSLDSDTVSLKRKAKGKRPFYFSDSDVDKLLTMVMALAGELSVTRDRLDTVERIAASKNLFSEEDIETFELDSDALEARAARHQILFREITRVISSEIEELDRESSSNYDQVIEMVESEGGRN
ncbi:hypothetical protein N9K98_00115 [Luminiphilus sp.]|jgi:hypothetical protein|nr:hypothetical protein [Luminiphilus sp.]MDB2689454.1 hypothetical protein [Luminiphilus sp.]